MEAYEVHPLTMVEKQTSCAISTSTNLYWLCFTRYFWGSYDEI